MSSLEQKSALKKFPATGWFVSQGSRAWAWLPGDEEVSRAEGAEECQSLRARARAAQTWEKEIPAHWWVLPTGLDLQVHLRHPGQPNKETIAGGLESALVGGYDGIVSMPNTNPYLDTAEALERAIESARALEEQYPVRIGFAAAATLGMKGEVPTDVDSLAAAGAVAITDDGWGVKSADAQDALFAACARNRLLFQQHAEMPGHKGVTPAGPFQRKHALPEYPRGAESGMVRRDVNLLRRHPKARYHVLHVTTKESVDEIRRAKAEGLRVSAEVTPHHLIFSNEDIPDPTDPRCTYFKMNPPLFAPEDRAVLREALRDGTIDCVSTDHAPHETELKAKGWLTAPFGTRGLETALPALLTLLAEGEISRERLVEVFSTAPRRLLGFDRFARPSGLLCVDPSARYRVGEGDLPGVSRNSCFLEAELQGRIELRLEPGAVYERA